MNSQLIRFLVLSLFCVALVLAGHTPAIAQADPATLSGRLAVLWVDVFHDGQMTEATQIVTLLDDDGVEHALALAPEVVAAHGGYDALQGRRVTVAVAPASAAQAGATLQVDALLAVEATATAPVLGNERWVMLLCRAAESAVVIPNPIEHYTRLWANEFPGMDHYWREVSYGQYSVAGSQVFGWYDLPQPGSAYWYPSSSGGSDLNVDNIRQDCSSVADSDVFFPDYKGIVFVVPLPADNPGARARGGQAFLNRDGVNRLYRVAYIHYEIGPDPEDILASYGLNILVHEMGHGLGLPHSSGPNTQLFYGTRWDVMNGLYLSVDCSQDDCNVHDTYGILASHTIAHHKDRLGWIAPARKVVTTRSNPQMITLTRLAQPRTSSPLMVQIPLTSDGSRFYTVERRAGGGYDVYAPYGTVMHKVDMTLPDLNAQVIDPDNNGNANDDGAKWTPGETFIDAANDIHVCVEAEMWSEVLIGVGNSREIICPFDVHIEEHLYFGSRSRYPAAGEQMTFYVEMENGGGRVAAGVSATVTVPAHVTVLSRTVDIYDGYAVSFDPLVVNFGDLGSLEYNDIQFGVEVDPTLTEPTLLEYVADITWQGGHIRRTFLQIANAEMIYLPTVQR